MQPTTTNTNKKYLYNTRHNNKQNKHTSGTNYESGDTSLSACNLLEDREESAFYALRKARNSLCQSGKIFLLVTTGLGVWCKKMKVMITWLVMWLLVMVSEGKNMTLYTLSNHPFQSACLDGRSFLFPLSSFFFFLFLFFFFLSSLSLFLRSFIFSLFIFLFFIYCFHTALMHTISVLAIQQQSGWYITKAVVGATVYPSLFTPIEIPIAIDINS